MQQRYTWLSTSIFACKSNWGYILKDIESYLEKSPDKAGFYLEFNSHCGENIRFSCLAPVQESKTMAKSIHEHFRICFKKNYYKRQQSKSQKLQIFKEFDQNTIHYGLYKINLPNTQELYNVTIEQGVSRLIIELLKKNNLDEEDLITFAYYLLLGLIRTIKKFEPLILSDLLDYCLGLLKDADRYQEFLSTSLKENWDTLCQIKKDILFSEDQSLPDWIGRWINNCLQSSNMVAEKRIGLLKIYVQITNQIFKQLGFSMISKTLVIYYIQSSLNNY